MQESKATYALEGNIAVTGAAVQWLGEFLGLENSRAVAELAKQSAARGEVYFVPAFVGLGAPHWNSAARGLISGLTRGSSAADLARATLDSIAYQVRDVFEAMKAETGRELSVLLADGGASANDDLMQFQSDILGCPVLRNQSTDISALGAAYLAGLGRGIWKSQTEIATLPRQMDRFEPQMEAGEREQLYEGWKTAVARAVCE
jgi:glycerol kinase